MRLEKSQRARALFTFVFGVPEPEVIEAHVELAPGMRSAGTGIRGKKSSMLSKA